MNSSRKAKIRHRLSQQLQTTWRVPEIFKLQNVSNKDALSICKRILHSTIRNKELQHFSKELSLSEKKFLKSFLLLTSTSLQNL